MKEFKEMIIEKGGVILYSTENYVLYGKRDEEGYIRLNVMNNREKEFRAEVYIDHNYKGLIEKVEINWASCGSQTIEKTKEFVEMVNEAVKFASEIENKDYSNMF